MVKEGQVYTSEYHVHYHVLATHRDKAWVVVTFPRLDGPDIVEHDIQTVSHNFLELQRLVNEQAR
jgi:hypothetical protein